MNDQQQMQKKFIGTWKLISSTQIDANGNKTYPFGEDAIGYIIYDEHNRMAVQITRQHRKPFVNDKFNDASANECHTLPQNYLAYFGRYEIDTAKKVVNHYLEGHLCPNNVGKCMTRAYDFYDNRISLKPTDGTHREIIWEKVTT